MTSASRPSGCSRLSFAARAWTRACNISPPDGRAPLTRATSDSAYSFGYLKLVLAGTRVPLAGPAHASSRRRAAGRAAREGRWRAWVNLN